MEGVVERTKRVLIVGAKRTRYENGSRREWERVLRNSGQETEAAYSVCLDSMVYNFHISFLIASC